MEWQKAMCAVKIYCPWQRKKESLHVCVGGGGCVWGVFTTSDLFESNSSHLFIRSFVSLVIQLCLIPQWACTQWGNKRRNWHFSYSIIRTPLFPNEPSWLDDCDTVNFLNSRSVSCLLPFCSREDRNSSLKFFIITKINVYIQEPLACATGLEPTSEKMQRGKRQLILEFKKVTITRVNSSIQAHLVVAESIL